jgi:hypothetical protein
MFGVPCAGCARQIRIDADTCWGCGRAVTAEERAAEHVRRVQRGRRWIGVMAILFAVSGLFGFASQKSGQLLGVNLALAGLLGAFWRVARRAPVAALASAIALILLVWIAQAVIDRSTVLDGYVVRLFALGAFAAGLRAALAARRAASAH